ncbi:MAG: hypothetical protein ACNS60_13610 [Candidatus Cyclobacteriaceae bacterium M2_1C_046]
MKKIIPFKNTSSAITTLDNGGRFYNLLTKAEDGNISTAELAKVAGLFGNKQQMVLYFAMSISELGDKEKVESALSDDLNIAYRKYAPQILLPSEAKSKGILSSNAIITGVPKMIESKSNFNGFIIVPVSTGKSISMIMIPIIDQYDVYEIRDNGFSETFLIAHSRGKTKLPEKKIKVGGILKELKVDKKGEKAPKMFLESLYYSEIK